MNEVDGRGDDIDGAIAATRLAAETTTRSEENCGQLGRKGGQKR